MKTEKLWISGMVRRNSDVNEILKDFAARTGINGKDLQHMSLLAEETLGMATQMLKDFDGEIWLEGTGKAYRIILEAEVRESGDALPEGTTGFMARIAELLNCSYMFENASEAPENLAAMLPDYMSYGMRNAEDERAWAGSWTLSAYRANLKRMRKGDPEALVRLDELEKSIVARLADDVTIGIHGHRVRMVITGRPQNA